MGHNGEMLIRFPDQQKTTEISYRDPTGKDYHQSQSEEALGSEIGFRKNGLNQVFYESIPSEAYIVLIKKY